MQNDHNIIPVSSNYGIKTESKWGRIGQQWSSGGSVNGCNCLAIATGIRRVHELEINLHICESSLAKWHNTNTECMEHTKDYSKRLHNPDNFGAFALFFPNCGNFLIR